MWWRFARGIIMKDLSCSKNDKLVLTGVFTFAFSGSVVAFGATVGLWVDSTACLQGILPFVEYSKIVKEIYT
jgi:hypothetical protein